MSKIFVNPILRGCLVVSVVEKGERGGGVCGI